MHYIFYALMEGINKMIAPTTLEMYEKAEEIQKYFWDGNNRKDEEFVIRYYQYPCKYKYYERKAFIGILCAQSNHYMTTLSKVVWLPDATHFKDLIPHKNLMELDDKFDEFKRMFYENHWFNNDRENSLEGRGEDPFNYFDTYDELWLGFVMMDRYQKRWDRMNWVVSDIYPDYFKMNREIARRDGYPDPDKLRYIIGLRGYVEE